MSMLTLGVSDMRRAVAFYQDGLGFPREGEEAEIAFFRLNGTWLALYARESLAADVGVAPQGAGFPGFAISHNVSCEAEVEAVMDQALAAGAELVKRPCRASWGGYSGYFRDPDGYLWEVAHNSFTWIGPADDPSA